MMRMKTNFHTLQVRKFADPNLRNAIFSKCNKELVNFISECVLNVLNGNTTFTGCDTRKLQKHKAALHKISDRRGSLSMKKKLIVQRGEFLLPLLRPIWEKRLRRSFKQSDAYRVSLQICPSSFFSYAYASKIRRGKQTMVMSVSVSANPPPPIKVSTYEPEKEERVEMEDNDDD